MRWPWARRDHTHFDYALLKYTTCFRCGHMVLSGHVRTKKVRAKVSSELGHGGVESTAVFGESCAPLYDFVEKGPDGVKHYYLVTDEKLTEIDPGEYVMPTPDEDE